MVKLKLFSKLAEHLQELNKKKIRITETRH